MSILLRGSVALTLTTLLLVTGCSSSHTTGDDAGRLGDAGPSGDASCTGSPSLFCVSSCGSDAGLPPICSSRGWACPSGTVDLSTCPPGCIGAPPSPSCVCRGTTWSCEEDRCPDDINPWDPSAPGSRCSVEGAHCTGGSSDACGSFLACDCEDGRWSCLHAEPDPVCWCGREPSVGDRCSEEGASCGECCPTPGGTGWAAMRCVTGQWQPAACPDLVCPPVSACPADRDRVLGTSCFSEGQSCGDGCCSTGLQCSGGVWVPGPELDCVCDPSNSFACGTGSCRTSQACQSDCGPADGIERTCPDQPGDCGSCECAATPPGHTCVERDGHLFFELDGFCG